MKIRKILLGLNLFSAIAFGQIYHGKIVQVGKQGNSVQVPIVVRQIDLDENTSISLVAADSIKPETVGIVFASEDSAGDRYATILNPSGPDIPFSLGANSQFINAVNQYRVLDIPVIASPKERNDISYAINQHKVIGIAELPWDMFEVLCRLDSIRISTKCRVIDLKSSERRILWDFHLYLVEREERPPDFIPYEKEPVVLKRVEPKYPERALREGLEDTVYIKAWVDRKGKVREAVVLKLRDDIFAAPAIEAAKQWVFTPALMKGEPIPVWVAIPIRFRLPGKR